MSDRGRAFRLRESPFHRPRTGCGWKRRGFTLIELLVVIAIIALLVTLLVPALQEAKRQARVVVCATNLKSYAMGLIVYGYEDESGKYPPHTEAGWGSTLKIWTSDPGTVYASAFPDKDASLTMYRDTICGGSFLLVWCPVYRYYYSPAQAGGFYVGETDPDYPLLWYDSRWGVDKYMGGYFRFANCLNVGYAESGNTRTDGPPVRPGSSRDAILCDTCESEPGNYFSAHIDGGGVSTAEAPEARRENNVGYGDGHVETHSQRAYVVGGGDYVSWDGAHYVLRAGYIRELY